MPQLKGYLVVVAGCMFAGKTTYIISEHNRLKHIGKRVLMINYSLDVRFSTESKIVTHDLAGTECVMTDSLEENDLQQRGINLNEYDAVIVNEAQFFSHLCKNVLKWCDDMNKYVVVSGLDGDYKRQPFGEIMYLLPHCDEYIKLKALCVECSDGTDGIFTWKTKDRNKEIVDIGGTDMYISLCRVHYNKKVNSCD